MDPDPGGDPGGALAPGSQTHPLAKQTLAPDSPLSTAADCARAIGLAEQLLSARGHNIRDYTLVSAQYATATAQEFRGVMSWRLAFKRRDLLPAGASDPIGAGGELFLDVNVHDARAVITGYGE